MNNCEMFRNASLKVAGLKLKDISVVGSGQNWFVEFTDNKGEEIKEEIHAHCKDCAISEAI